MPGYSGTPLPKKLGLRSGSRVRLVHVPVTVRRALRTALASCTETREPIYPLDFVLICAVSRADLAREFEQNVSRLSPTGAIWASWPKKASGVGSDLSDDIVRGIGLRAGLVDVKVCALSDTWSALRFVHRAADRGGRLRTDGRSSGARSSPRGVEGARQSQPIDLCRSTPPTVTLAPSGRAAT